MSTPRLPKNPLLEMEEEIPLEIVTESARPDEREIKKAIEQMEDYGASRQPALQSNPILELAVDGVYSEFNKERVIMAIDEIQAAGYDVKSAINQVISEKVDIRSVLQVIDVLVAQALWVRPEFFTDDPGTSDVVIKPIDLKAYFTILFLNRMRSVNELSGNAIGSIPFVSEEAVMPRALFEMLCAMSPFKRGNQKGMLTMEYNDEFTITNGNIADGNYNSNNLSTPACPTFLGPTIDQKGIHSLVRDQTLGEVLTIESDPLTPVTLSEYWDILDEQRITQVVGVIWPIRFAMNQLPMHTESADFYASTNGTAEGYPQNNVFNPFSHYSEEHATVFTFFKRSNLRATLNVRRTMQASVKPAVGPFSAQYSKPFVVASYVLGGYLNNSPQPSYLGAGKYYTVNGEKYRPTPQFKPISHEAIKAHAVDVARAYIGVLGDAISAQTRRTDNDVSVLVYNSPRFYREASFCMLTKIYKTVQMHTFGFMANPSRTCLYNQAHMVQLGGSLALIQNELAPVIADGNLILPYMDFESEDQITPFYEMDFAQFAPRDDALVIKAYPSTLDWNSVAADANEYRVRFAETIIDQIWIDAYEALPGHRKVPSYSTSSSQNYEQMISAYVSGSPSLLSQGLSEMGGALMVTYTKFNRNFDRRRKLPYYDLKPGPAETPYCTTYQHNVKALFYTRELFGQTLAESSIGVASFDILFDNADKDNSFVQTVPVATLGNSQNPWELFNSECADPNGIVQKAIAANISAYHGPNDQIRVLGQTFVKKEDDNMCFFKAIGSALSSVANTAIKVIQEPVATSITAVKNLVTGEKIWNDIADNGPFVMQGAGMMSNRHYNALIQPHNSSHSTSTRKSVVHNRAKEILSHRKHAREGKRKNSKAKTHLKKKPFPKKKPQPKKKTAKKENKTHSRRKK